MGKSHMSDMLDEAMQQVPRKVSVADIYPIQNNKHSLCFLKQLLQQCRGTGYCYTGMAVMHANTDRAGAVSTIEEPSTNTHERATKVFRCCAVFVLEHVQYTD